MTGKEWTTVATNYIAALKKESAKFIILEPHRIVSIQQGSETDESLPLVRDSKGCWSRNMETCRRRTV